VHSITDDEKISVAMANGSIIQPYAAGRLRLKQESLPAFLFRELSGSLISVGQIVDAFDGRAVFERTHMYISKKCDDSILLEGTRCPKTKLWLANLDATPSLSNHACAAHAVPVQTMSELVQYWHESFGCPVASTFLDIVKSGRLVIPELPYKTLYKYRKSLHSVASAKGHLDQTRKNIRSTDPEKRPRRSTRAPYSAATLERDTAPDDILHIDLTYKLHDYYVMLSFSPKKNYIHFELLPAQSEKRAHGHGLQGRAQVPREAQGIAPEDSHGQRDFPRLPRDVGGSGPWPAAGCTQDAPMQQG
jgi:hypothetical protein